MSLTILVPCSSRLNPTIFMKRIPVYLLTALLSPLCGLQLPAAETPPNEQTQPPAATPAPPPSAPAKRSAAELEKLVLPIALHPDPLISILLPASAYPLEIVQAARFVKDTNNIPKVDDQPWDDNVKEVAKFPELIAMMDKDIKWTMDLGQAFIEQSEDLMSAIQTLRAKAQKAGNLKTNPQQIVTVTNIVVQQTNITEVVNVTKEIVQVIPANPSVVYVPTYPPAVYYPAPYAYAAPLLTFGVGMMWGAAIANNCNWGHGSVDVDVNRNVNRNTNRNTDRSGNRSQTGNRASSTGAKSGSQKWQPNQSRMQQSGAKASASTQNARGWGGSSGAKPSTGNVGSRPSTGSTGARPSTGTAASRPSAGSGASARPATSQSSGRTSSPSASSRSSGGSAFSGAGSGGGSSARASSSRGSSSRSSGGFSGGVRSGGSRGGGGGGGRR